MPVRSASDPSRQSAGGRGGRARPLPPAGSVVVPARPGTDLGWPRGRVLVASTAANAGPAGGGLLGQVLRVSDVVSLHTVLDASTHHLINRERLGGVFKYSMTSGSTPLARTMAKVLRDVPQ